ncbi:hypothetical protein [Scytonema sp. NUACC21]
MQQIAERLHLEHRYRNRKKPSFSVDTRHGSSLHSPVRSLKRLKNISHSDRNKFCQHLCNAAKDLIIPLLSLFIRIIDLSYWAK